MTARVSAAMRDKIADNLEQFLQRPLAPRKPNSEIPPEVLLAVCLSNLEVAVRWPALQSPKSHGAATLAAALSPLTGNAFWCNRVLKVKLSCLDEKQQMYAMPPTQGEDREFGPSI